MVSLPVPLKFTVAKDAPTVPISRANNALTLFVVRVLCPSEFVVIGIYYL